MITWIELGAALALTFVATTTVAAIMWRPLHGVLEFICHGGAAARFWTTFSAVMLVCGPLFLVSFAAGRSLSMADFIRQAVYLCSLGLIGAFVIMGVAVWNAAQVGRVATAAPADPWRQQRGSVPAAPAE
jgi:hypothetical protein